MPHLRDAASGGSSTSAPARVPRHPAPGRARADRALLVESVGKKGLFLRTVIKAIGLGDGRPRRRSGPRRSPATRGPRAWPAVTARAVTWLAELVELGLPLLGPGGVLVAWKAGP